MTSKAYLQSIDQVVEELNRNLYIADRALATVIFLAHRLQKPLFLEGEPGVGKTEVGTVMAKLLDTELIRLQCYEGLDASAALYEWNYPKQLLHIKIEPALAMPVPTAVDNLHPRFPQPQNGANDLS